MNIYSNDERINKLIHLLNQGENRLYAGGLTGSSRSMLAHSIAKERSGNHLIVMQDKETAAYFYNDLELLFNEKEENYSNKHILFFPTSYKRAYEPDQTDNANVLSRSEVINRLGNKKELFAIVSYPEALCEKVVSRNYLSKARLEVKVGDSCGIDFLTDIFSEYDFERTDFVIEAGQFSIRGGIVDVFSYADELPYRVEFDGEDIESIRRFDPTTQLSKEKLNSVTILPNIHQAASTEVRQSIFSLFPTGSVLWMDDLAFAADRVGQDFDKIVTVYENLPKQINHIKPELLYLDKSGFFKEILNLIILEFGRHKYFKDSISIDFNTTPQPPFHKNFELLKTNLEDNYLKGYSNIIYTDSEKQEERIHKIFDDILTEEEKQTPRFYKTIRLTLHEGFIDHDRRIACYTDHQIFERYHRFQLREGFTAREALTIKELYGLKPGDYVTHIDHGVGRFDGLEKIENNGKIQEALRIIYKNEDILYVNIHSLHRISRYTGKEGAAPSMNRLGSNTWNKIKESTKKRVKDIAKDLIKLYAERRATQGFSFTPDTYLQHELEASFMFEDTPDQIKSTVDVKGDMEAEFPMDRLICGDVGFGKTEIAVRAAFKAVTDSKQVALLVPTTILALQHYKTFSER